MRIGKLPTMAHTRSHPILLVDDDPDLLLMMKTGLENQGYDVLTRESAPTRDEMSVLDPAVVFMDVNLQEENGAAVCSAIKRDSHSQHPPVILISALGEGELRRSTEASLADGCLIKPFTLNSLLVMAEYYTKAHE